MPALHCLRAWQPLWTFCPQVIRQTRSILHGFSLQSVGRRACLTLLRHSATAGLLQKSFWLIDPYWTLLPPLVAVFYLVHPTCSHAQHPPDWTRSGASLVLIAVWSVRLTHSYFRREEWKFGQREDWRYTKMAKDFGSTSA